MTTILSRRNALRLLAGSALGMATTPALAGSPQCLSVPPAPKVPPSRQGPALGDIARAKGIAFGIQSGIDPTHDYGDGLYDPAYFQLILSEKPDFLAFGQQFNFGNVATDPPDGDVLRLTNSAYHMTNTWYLADDIAPRLQAAHIGARADAMIWDDEQVRQSWLRPVPRGSSPDRRKNANLDWNIARAEDYLGIAFDKIEALSRTDPGFMRIVIPVNEPLDIWALPGKVAYRGGFFCPQGVEIDPATGVADYIRALYRVAGRRVGANHATRPKLIINEAGTEEDQAGPLVRAGLLRLLRMMKAEGLPLDGVGIESHLQPQMMADPLRPDWGPFGAFLDEVADLGLEIHLTELDVLDFATSCNGRPGTPAESDALVAHYFETFLTRALQCRALKSVCVWDLSDRYSFYRSMDVDTWYGYDQFPKGTAPADWPKCARMPRADAISCPRPDIFDDRYVAKSARAAIARALSAAPARG